MNTGGHHTTESVKYLYHLYIGHHWSMSSAHMEYRCSSYGELIEIMIMVHTCNMPLRESFLSDIWHNSVCCTVHMSGIIHRCGVMASNHAKENMCNIN